MARNKVEICGVNTSSLPLLSNEEKEALFEKIEQGDNNAREQYIKGNLRLVLSIIQRFSSSGENADDLFQVGCIGLMKAIDNFDRNLNVKFSTYAVPMIIGEVKRYLRDNHSLRVSRSLRDTAYKAISTRESLTKKLNHEPTIDAIAKGIDMKKGGEKDFLPSIIILSIIEIPTLIVTLFCIFIKIPQSNSRHIMATALFAFVALIYVLCRKKKIEILFI